MVCAPPEGFPLPVSTRLTTLPPPGDAQALLDPEGPALLLPQSQRAQSSRKEGRAGGFGKDLAKGPDRCESRRTAKPGGGTPKQTQVLKGVGHVDVQNGALVNGAGHVIGR